MNSVLYRSSCSRFLINKAYLMTDEKHNSYQYVVTVYGEDFDDVRKTGESVIASMVYNENLETQFVRKSED